MGSQRNYWLMKTEPDVFSFEDLVNSPNSISCWEGVRNYQARNFMRDEFRIGDGVLIYHSRQKFPAVVGVAEVVREAYDDFFALNPKSPYFDEKSAKIKKSRWVMVDVQAHSAFKTPVTLQQCRQEKTLKDMLLIKPGQRLSIQPVRKSQWDFIINLGESTDL
jgi:predicted RNA-binding protein with PUA-like domain